jgi:hypothetical protein
MTESVKIENIDEQFIIQFIKDHPLPDKWHENKKEEILKEIVEYLENNPKYVIDHSHDPPYDSSGELKRIAEHFLLTLYDTVEDFLEELNGGCEPSYSSGNGWYYPSIGDALGDRDYHMGWIYANHYFEMLKQEYDCVNDGDENDNWGQLWENLMEYNFKLNKEINDMKLMELYTRFSKQNALMEYDKKSLRDIVVKIIKNYGRKSEVWLTRNYPDTPIFEFGGQLKRIIDVEKYGDGVHTQCSEFHYRLNHALVRKQPVAMMLETPKEDGLVEIRGILIQNGIIKDILPNDLKDFYSIDPETEERDEPPENCVFLEFESKDGEDDT